MLFVTNIYNAVRLQVVTGYDKKGAFMAKQKPNAIYYLFDVKLEHFFHVGRYTGKYEIGSPVTTGVGYNDSPNGRAAEYSPPRRGRFLKGCKPSEKITRSLTDRQSVYIVLTLLYNYS